MDYPDDRAPVPIIQSGLLDLRLSQPLCRIANVTEALIDQSVIK
jgi:hypothetical protein